MRIEVFHDLVPADIAVFEGDEAVAVVEGLELQHGIVAVVQHVLKAFEIAAVEAGDDDGMPVDLRNDIGGIVQKTIFALVGREKTIKGAVVEFQVVRVVQVSLQFFAGFGLLTAGNQQQQAKDYRYRI